MKFPLFDYPTYRYEVDNWQFHRKSLLDKFDKSKFIRTKLQSAESDRETNNGSYIDDLIGILHSILSEFCQEAQVSCSMTDAWAVRYYRGDHQAVHNHRGWGFSGVLYAEFDPKVHTPTCFVAPWQEPRTDTTHLEYPQDVKEGTVIIFPSFTHHYVDPNSSRKRRTVVSFDLLPEQPEWRMNKSVTK